VPKEANSVSLNSIEVSMKPLSANRYEPIPVFRTTSEPSNLNPRIYHYQVSQYWPTDGYSTDVYATYFTQSNYQYYQDFLSNNAMNTEERNEVWMFDVSNDEIFQIQFFTMGKKDTTTPKIYAVLVKHF
jgi:hypothetical protein